jgi:putative phage-type endonuclease
MKISQKDQNDLNEIFNTIYTGISNSDGEINPANFDELISMMTSSIDTFYPHLEYVKPHLIDCLNITYKISSFDYDKLEKITAINELSINDQPNNLNTNNHINIFDKDFITSEERDEYYNLNRHIDISNSDENFKKLFNQYEYLINLPQPAQKSSEWFELRNGMLTASNGGAAIGKCHYSGSTIKSVLLDKLGLGEKFKENEFVYHGKKYEKIAIMIYENIYNTKIGEFGLVQHNTIKYLGASPDGISMSMTLDGKPNEMMGRMLEIKCPPSRKIKNTGKICGDICPEHYWIQVQLQLECCNLPECDFWQCHIIEYYNEDEFLFDDINDLVHTSSCVKNQDDTTEIIDEPNQMYIDERIRKGAIMELYPKSRIKIPQYDKTEWYAKYIYPPSILKTPTEYKTWTDFIIKNWTKLYPDYALEYKFNKIVYWKLKMSHNELIMRQPAWFDSTKDLYKKFWERVEYYRKNIEEAKIDIKEQRLSNEVFLQTDTPKIGKITSLNNYKKDQHNSSIFIKSKQNLESETFLSSSDKEINQNQKLPKTKNTTKTNKPNKKNDDIFLSSDSPSVPKTSIQDIPNNKSNNYRKELLYKTPSKSRSVDDLELVIINRKKK